MEGNYLQSIPEVVVSLPSLEVLVLSDNEITFLHQDLDNLFQLKELYLDDNKLSELPASLLPYLAELEKLNLSNNKKVLTLGKNEKPKKRSQTKAKMNHVDAKVTTERLTGLGAPETSSTSVVAQDRSMVFSEINLNHPEEERDIFGGKPGLVNLKSEDADPNIAERVKRNTLSAKARVGQAMRPSPKWGILIRELKKAGFLPSIKVQLPKLRREERRPVKVVNHGSRYTWRGWRVDANSQSTLKRKTSSVESESLDNKLDEFGHLASISELFPEVKMEQGRLTLDLSWQELSYVSGTICELVNLNSLLLDHNQVTDLPTGMDKLSKLRILSLNSNEMISLPENLRHLNYLRRLFLSGNHIRALPDWFEGFQQLTYLSLENNDMPFFPTEICSLVKLEYLLLAGNKIGELPEKIKQLKKLRELFLGRNVIRLIPLSIAEMNSLRVLYLDNNGLEEIPYSVLSVMELQTLNLSGNSLNLIPDNIINLRDLEELDLGKNNIQKLPFWFHRLANLRVLSLNCNGMSVFPEVLCKSPYFQLFSSLFFGQLNVVELCLFNMADSHLSQDEVAEIRESFSQFDLDGNGHITCQEIGSVMKALGEDIPGYKLREIIKEVDKNKNGTVEFNEFLEIYKQNSKKFSAGSEFKKLIKKRDQLESSGGTSESSAEGTKHSYSEAERVAFVDWINTALKDDKEAQAYLPINPATSDVFEKMKDGIILCKMINLSVPDTVDERAINKPQSGKSLSIYKIHENMTLALNSARSIGCNIVNIGAEDLEKGKPHLVLGVLWQIIRIGLFANITLTNVPGLARLLREGETINDLMALSPEEILLRWFNYHLEQAGHHRRVHNFSDDIKDSECYSILLSRITPTEMYVDNHPMREKDLNKRAEKMLQMADRINCRKFVRPKDVVSGNSKLNMAFVANLFNSYPGLPPMDAEEVDLEEAREETREEKTFRNWMNSIGVNPYVNHLYRDLCSGLVLLQLYDIVQPGVVNWDKVNRPPFKQMGGKMKKLENCNYAVEIGKKVKFSLVGIGGQDIHDCNETLTLAVVWQQMRSYTLALLSRLNKDGKTMEDKDIVDWVNEKLKSANKSSSIASFKDPAISSSQAVLDLVDAIKPGIVDYSLVTPGDTDEEKHENAKYALSVARKIGATTYALPDDLVEVKPKMVLTVFACLMATALALE
ncbi:unnamed protein product [Porites lobata]|uniref:Plastin-3 n=1 Tax=Porites lobata TaxID=104759 RepID=A0ABN8N8U2_9CNID|nr:unnamed protein product [Porites lobata]